MPKLNTDKISVDYTFKACFAEKRITYLAN